MTTEKIIEFKNADSTMFVRLESGEIYGNTTSFVAFWRKSENEAWNKQGYMPNEQKNAQIEHLLKSGFTQI